MDKKEITEILNAVRSGELRIKDAIQRLSMCYESLGFATVDVGRQLRTGVSEVLFCEGKTQDQVVEIAKDNTLECFNEHMQNYGPRETMIQRNIDTSDQFCKEMNRIDEIEAYLGDKS